MLTLSGPETGKTLDSSTIQQGLKELCPDLHFDLAAAIGQWHPSIEDRQGVYYCGKHLCSMDRGLVPEFKIWSVVKQPTRIEWWEADKDDASIQYRTLLPNDPMYEDGMRKARSGSDPQWLLLADGRVAECYAVGQRPVKGPIVRLGWRHTFERLLQHGVTGITRQSLSAKFGVDMLKYPMGPPEEVYAALVEE